MTPDEMNLRHKLRLWERRFVDGSSQSVEVMIRTKDEFWRKHGWDVLMKIITEVTIECANELREETRCEMPILRTRERPLLSDVRRVRKNHAHAKPKERRFRYVARV